MNAMFIILFLLIYNRAIRIKLYLVRVRVRAEITLRNNVFILNNSRHASSLRS